MNNNNNNNNTAKTDPSKQGQSTVQPIRDEHAKQASAPGKSQDAADTAKQDASGTDSTRSTTGDSAK
jgi:hypothetical protein